MIKRRDGREVEREQRGGKRETGDTRGLGHKETNDRRNEKEKKE